jgi:hypothetical protein
VQPHVGVNINQFAREETLDLEPVKVMVDWFDFKWVCHDFLCVSGVSDGLPPAVAMWRPRPGKTPVLERSWISEVRLKVPIINERYNQDTKKASFFAFRGAFRKRCSESLQLGNFRDHPISGTTQRGDCLLVSADPFSAARSCRRKSCADSISANFLACFG